MWANMYWYVKAALFAVIGLVLVGIWTLLGKPGMPSPSTVEDPDGDNTEVILVADELVEVERDDGQTPPRPTAAERQTPELIAEQKKISLARRKYDDGKLVDARSLLESVLRNPAVTPYGQTWDATTDLLSEINGVFLSSDAPCPEKTTYVVKSGDSLWTIAKAHHTTIELIQKINGLDVTNPNIYEGQTLSIFQADWQIHVSKSEYLLILKNGDRIMRTYTVGIGRQDRTPVGTFMMVDKVREPPWTNKGKVIPFGSPDNVLGTRWMKIMPTGSTNPNLLGYGIHGTWEPESTGTAASNGCIRMRNEQVEELFDIVPVDVPVTIVE